MLTLYSQVSRKQQEKLLQRSESASSLNITPESAGEEPRQKLVFDKLYDRVENMRVLKREYGIKIPEESLRASSLAERLEALSCLKDKDVSNFV